MNQTCPRAVEGLLTCDHAKRGRRFVSILDPETQRVTLLEPWEHAVLVLCDAEHTPAEIAEVLRDGVAGESVSKKDVGRCLKFFERDGLIEEAGFRSSAPEPPPGARTLAQMQQAFHEWHRDPVLTGQILAGTAPFVDPGGELPVGLQPTVALPDEDEPAKERAERTPVAVGTTLVLGSDQSAFGGSADELHSVLEVKEGLQPARDSDRPTEVGELAHDDDDPPEIGIEEVELEPLTPEVPVEDVADLLKAVDDDLERIEAAERMVPPPVGRAEGGEVEFALASDATNVETNEASYDGLETYEMRAADRGGLMDPEPSASLVLPRLETQRMAPPIAPQVQPTMVGLPVDGADGPRIISPPRQPSAAGALSEDTARIDEAEISQSDLQDSGLEDPGESTSRTVAPFDRRTRRVFESLWRSGIAARSDAEREDVDADGRRSQAVNSQRFDEGLARLNEGELEFAMVHFAALAERLPQSDRIAAFATAIRDVLKDEPGRPTADTPSWQGLYSVAEIALNNGRCPQCLSEHEPGERACDNCGFALTESDSLITAEGKARSVVD